MSTCRHGPIGKRAPDGRELFTVLFVVCGVVFACLLAGLHRAGLHRAGLHRAGLHRAGLHRADLHRAGLHRAGLQLAALLPGWFLTWLVFQLVGCLAGGLFELVGFLNLWV